MNVCNYICICYLCRNETCKLLPLQFRDDYSAAQLKSYTSWLAHPICARIQSAAQHHTNRFLNLWFPKRFKRSVCCHSCCAFQLSCKPVMTTGMRGFSYSSTNDSYDILCTLQYMFHTVSAVRFLQQVDTGTVWHPVQVREPSAYNNYVLSESHCLDCRASHVDSNDKGVTCCECATRSTSAPHYIAVCSGFYLPQHDVQFPGHCFLQLSNKKCNIEHQRQDTFHARWQSFSMDQGIAW